MDTTSIGSDFKDLFIIQDLASRRVLTWCLVPAKLTSENIVVALEKALDNHVGPVVPEILHGDNSPLYSSTVFQDFIKQSPIKRFSTSVGVQHGNQVIEAFFNGFKTRLCLAILDKKVLRLMIP